MKYFAIIILVLSSYLNLQGQEVDTKRQGGFPKISDVELAIKYFGIEFTSIQRKKLDTIEVELLVLVNELGRPKLAEVNGLSDLAMIDSLRAVTNKLEPFNPLIQDGIAQSAIYSLKLRFPSYPLAIYKDQLLNSKPFSTGTLDEFEYLTLTETRTDLVLGGITNMATGKLAQYLSPAIGYHLNLTFSGNNKLLYGVNMALYQNGLNESFPVNSNREQKSPLSVMFGLSMGKWYKNLNIRGDLNYVIQHFSNTDEDNDKTLRTKGWSPGITINYPILIGKEKPRYNSGRPSLFGSNINIHAGLRYLNHSLKEASGLIVEFGLSWRQSMKDVKDYKFKQEAIDRYHNQ